MTFQNPTYFENIFCNNLCIGKIVFSYDVDIQCSDKSGLGTHYEQEKEIQLLSSPVMNPGETVGDWDLYHTKTTKLDVKVELRRQFILPKPVDASTEGDEWEFPGQDGERGEIAGEGGEDQPGYGDTAGQEDVEGEEVGDHTDNISHHLKHNHTSFTIDLCVIWMF